MLDALLNLPREWLITIMIGVNIVGVLVITRLIMPIIKQPKPPTNSQKDA